jgi:signal peptidase I
LLVIVALVVAVALRAFVVQVFYIPSSSMVPTLEIDDRIVVEKITYRFREPRRGDVIVFSGVRNGERPDIGGEGGVVERTVRQVGRAMGVIPPVPSDLVKRLIGLPGDEVAVIDGLVNVNGVPLGEPYLSGPVASDFGPITVPAGELFFLGDNRRNSADSRGSLGSVARDRVIGRAVAVIWPARNASSLLGQRPVLFPQSTSVG